MGWAKRMRHRFLEGGGVRPPARKQTASMKIVSGPIPEFVVIPMQQHVGSPCVPIVEAGEKVLVGQKIGDSDHYMSAPVHACVSGTVDKILEFPHPTGGTALAVKIVNDKQDTRVAGLAGEPDPLDLSADEVRKRVREAGIVGMGGAAFPTAVKLAPPKDKPIEIVILNGSECEPYLTADYRTMIEKAEAVVKGGLVVKQVVGADRIVAGIEDHSEEAIRVMTRVGEQYGLEVIALPSRYPAGAEKTLVKYITGREIPSGGLPMDVGALVNNVGTCAAIQESLTTGMPLIERVLTVAGDGVAGRANLIVRIGTPVGDVIDFCGGLVGKKGKVILGGPMMGLAQYTTEVPVIKNTSGIVVLRGESLFRGDASQFTCIRCGRCVKKCPQNLLPYQMGAYANAGMWEQLEALHITDCVECGSCAYICPNRNPMVQLMKVGKGGLARRKKKMEDLTAKDEVSNEESAEKETVDDR